MTVKKTSNSLIYLYLLRSIYFIFIIKCIKMDALVLLERRTEVPLC